MNILFLIDVYPHQFKPYLDVHFQDLVSAGHEVHVLSLAASRGSPEKRLPDGVSIQLLGSIRENPLLSCAQLLRAALQSPRRLFRLLMVLTRAHGRLKDVLRIVALDCQIPRRRADVYFVHNLAAAVQFWYLPKIDKETPLVLYYHGGELPGVPTIPREAARRAFATADLTFTNTRASAQDVVARGCPQRKVRVVPVGFRVQDYQPDRVTQLRQSTTIRLLAVGRVAVEKGLDIALQALLILREDNHRPLPQLTIVGDGPDLPRLMRLANEWRLSDNVRFAGRLEHPAVLAQMQNMDALILPSIGGNTCSETQACVLQEAMLMRLPVIASSIGGVPESVPTDFHRYLFSPGDARQLADRIVALFSLDDRRRGELGAIGRTFVSERYDVRNTNNALLHEISRIRRS